MVEKKKKEEVKGADFGLDIKEMAEAGLQFGHKPSKLHPRMMPFVFKKRKNVYLINLEETKESLAKALEYIQEVAGAGKKILFVGTKIQHKEIVKDLGEKCGFSFVTERWLGGLLTNFKVMRKRVEYFQELKEKIESSDFEEYTKKEQFDMKRELQVLIKKFGGIEDLKGLPDAIFICDLKEGDLAFKEARRKSIPVVAVVDVNIDPTFVDYPIFANDDARSSMAYILNKVEEMIAKAGPPKEIEPKKAEAKEIKEDKK